MLIKQCLQISFGDWLSDLGRYFYCGEIAWLLFELLECEHVAGDGLRCCGFEFKKNFGIFN